MKTVLKYLSALVLLFFVASCVENETDAGFDFETPGVYGYLAPVVFEDEPATKGTADPNTLQYVWEEGDRINIWSNTGSLLIYKVEEITDEGRRAKFSGGGFTLTNGETYYSSHPLILSVLDGYKTLTASYEGETQKADNDASHIVDYMYTYSSAVCTNGNTSFQYHHLSSFIKFNVTLPKAMTLTELTLTADSPVFALNGTVDVTTGSFTAGDMSNVMTLKLDDIQVSDVLKASLAVAPFDAGTFVVRVKDSEGVVYSSAEISKAALAAGNGAIFNVEVSEGVNPVVKVGDVEYYTLTEAIAEAQSGSIIQLLADYDASDEQTVNHSRPLTKGSTTGDSEVIPIDKSLTIDGNSYTLTVNGRCFAPGLGATTNIDVTFKDITIVNSNYAARCIETYGHIGTLTLDNVTLSTEGATSGHSKSTYAKPFVIGGNQSDVATVNIINSTILTNSNASAYYSITTCTPVNMTVSNSTLRGWACILAMGPKGVGSSGSAGSSFTVDGCTLESNNVYSEGNNSFGAFVAGDDNVTIDITNSDIDVHNSGDQMQVLSLFYSQYYSRYLNSDHKISGGCLTLGAGNNVTFDNTGTGYCDFYYNDGANSLRIVGGTFNVDPTAFVPSGYHVVQNGSLYTVVAD